MPSALAVLDISRLRRISDDDESFLQELLDELLQDTSQQIVMLLRAVEQADLTTCARLAHKAKGSCASVGADSLAALFNSVERGASARDAKVCRTFAEHLFPELDKLRFEITHI